MMTEKDPTTRKFSEVLEDSRQDDIGSGRNALINGAISPGTTPIIVNHQMGVNELEVRQLDTLEVDPTLSALKSEPVMARIFHGSTFAVYVNDSLRAICILTSDPSGARNYYLSHNNKALEKYWSSRVHNLMKDRLSTRSGAPMSMPRPSGKAITEEESWL